MNGIKNFRDGAFGLMIFSLFGATIYEYGKQRETVKYLFERWSAYQANCLKVAFWSLVIALLLTAVLWIVSEIRKERRRQDDLLIKRTERRVNAARDESDRIRERNRHQIGQRWARELRQQP